MTEEEEKKLLERLLDYYKKLYPGVEFAVKEAKFSRKELGEIAYTYSGEETEATAAEKMRRISSAIGNGYVTPIIVLKSNSKNVLLDGHRRVRVAYGEGLGWKAYVIVPQKTGIEFGIENMILGKVADLYGK
ncbi:MAG: ParB N-terminal domain-containing protein [Candidatus Micrarchaeota archaeon]